MQVAVLVSDVIDPTLMTNKIAWTLTIRGLRDLHIIQAGSWYANFSGLLQKRALNMYSKRTVAYLHQLSESAIRYIEAIDGNN